MQPADDFGTVLAYLRRKYYTPLTESWDVATLRTMADTAFTAGTRTVTITATSTEAGGSAQGTVTFDRLVLLAALEALLAEADPAGQPPEQPSTTIVNFGHSPLSL